MSDSKLLLRFLAGYVNGEKDFNIDEIKGGIKMYEMNLQSSTESNQAQVETESSVSDSSNNKKNKSYVNLEFDLHDIGGELEPVDNNVPQQSSNSKRTTENKWSQKFVDEISLFALEAITKKRCLPQQELIKLFDKKFYAKVPESDKIQENKARPKYIDKVHKSIYNNLIKSDKVEYVNGSYLIIRKESA
jgi:hypothetical protein